MQEEVNGRKFVLWFAGLGVVVLLIALIGRFVIVKPPLPWEWKKEQEASTETTAEPGPQAPAPAPR